MRRALITALLLLCGAVSSPRVTHAASPPPDAPALAAVLRDLCGKRVALLGEATHGDGRTIAFKAALVRRLIERCGYDAVFFESSHYDFLELSRRLRTGGEATPATLASSVGGLWNGDREFAPLLAYLFDAARTGKVALGGLDDQLGSAGAFFSISDMPARLTAALPAARRDDCREQMRRRIYSSYPREAPYGPAARAALQRCLREASMSLPARAADTADSRQMIVTIQRLLGRDFLPQNENIRERDRAMYANFRWLAARLPRGAKVILWSATSHIAKDARALPHYAGGGNLGASLHRDYRRRAFALGFSAGGGATRVWGAQNRPVPPARPDSLEARALASSPRSQTVYLGPDRLRASGALPAGAFGHEPVTTRWSDVLDGLVVFRSERPPTRVD